jgi:hypothetical protein
MSQPSLREELREAFAAMTRTPDAGLAMQIRERIGAMPAPRRRVPRAAVAVAVVVSLVVIVDVVAAARLGSHPLPAARSAGTARQASPAATPQTAQPSQPAPPSVTPTPSAAEATTAPAPVAGLPGFACSVQSGGGSGPAAVTAVRSGPQKGYDRFVIQFDRPAPRYEVRPQDQSGLLVVVHNASSRGTYTGPPDLQPRMPALKDARQMDASADTVQWNLTLSHAACFRAFVLTGPGRLVVDIES